MTYFILVKRRGTKSWKGALPTIKGNSKKKLSLLARKLLRKTHTYRIVTGTQLKQIIKQRITN